MTLETDLLNAWQDATADLTPEEKEVLAQGTAEDWTRAIAELIRDPGFWQGIGAAFVDGMMRGLTR
jgi:hypothetical protein